MTLLRADESHPSLSIVLDNSGCHGLLLQTLLYHNFMTVVVRFQLIFLNRVKCIAFRDLSPNRPFQELYHNDINFVSIVTLNLVSKFYP